MNLRSFVILLPLSFFIGLPPIQAHSFKRHFSVDSLPSIASRAEISTWLNHTGGNKYTETHIGCLEGIKMIMGNELTITLNKCSNFLYESRTGDNCGLSGEAYTETKKCRVKFCLNKGIRITCNIQSKLNVRAPKDDTISITLLRGNFVLVVNKIATVYSEPGIEYVFTPFGKLIKMCPCDTSQSTAWTKNVTIVENENLDIKPLDDFNDR